MPKIVDHDAMRQEIALKAAYIFLNKGYKNIGMRQLCEELGMSKSAVYHYYKGKDELFRASTEAIVNSDVEVLTDCPLAIDASLPERSDNFVLFFDIMSARYFSEMKLIFDYIDVIGQDKISQDECMQLARQKYQNMLAKYVDSEQAESLMTILIGLLTHQVINGSEMDSAKVSAIVRRFLAKP